MIYIIIQIIMIGFFGGVNEKPFVSDFNFKENCKDSVIYEVKAGDNLYKIAQSFGHASFWEYIYVANSSSVKNPHRIFPGQIIEIPARIAAYKNSDLDLKEVLNNPFCSIEEVPLSQVKVEFLVSIDFEKLVLIDSLHSYPSKSIDKSTSPQESSITNAGDTEQKNKQKEIVNEDIDIKGFRKAFNELVKSEKQNDPDIKRTELIKYEIDGIVLDETISKVGRDFYHIFYQNWSPPQDAYNFTITISEKPSPSLGTIVMVKVNETYTYQARLQPRYELVVSAGKQAVRNSYQFLRNNKNRLKIY